MKTIDEIRHENLLRIIARAKSIQAVADALGKSHAQISQLKNRNTHSGSAKRRALGDDLAREIEGAFGLERGWMDNEDAPFDDEPVTSDRSSVVVADMLSKADPTSRRLWRDMTRSVLQQNSSAFTGEEVARYDAAIDEVVKIPNPGKSSSSSSH